MKKEFSKFQVATLKRVAQSVYPLVRVKERLTKEINEREKELESIQIQIDAFQGPIKEMTGGYSSEDLIVREVITTDKLDKDGKPVKVTKYNLKYPETIVPPVVEDNAGSDFDVDVPKDVLQALISHADEVAEEAAEFTAPEPNF